MASRFPISLALVTCLAWGVFPRAARAIDPPAPTGLFEPQSPTQVVVPADDLFTAPEAVDHPVPPTPETSEAAQTASMEVSEQAPAILPLSPEFAPAAGEECWVPGLDDSLSTDADGNYFVSKQSNVTYTLIPAGSEDVSFNRFDFQHVLQAKSFPRFRLTPRFAWNLVGNDPVTELFPGFNLTDIPNQLYEVAIDATVFIPIGDRWTIQGSIAPSLFTDFENTTSGAARIPSKLVAYYQWSQAATIAAGVAYLDREDISTVGYFGLLLGVPGEEWKVELLFPRSRIAYRVAQNAGREHWIYVAQDFIGGASWGMEHSYGLKDVVTYRDERVSLGYEWVVDGQSRVFVEGGYVYDRELEFRELGRGRLSSTGVFRIGMNF